MYMHYFTGIIYFCVVAIITILFDLTFSDLKRKKKKRWISRKWHGLMIIIILISLCLFFLLGVWLVNVTKIINIYIVSLFVISGDSILIITFIKNCFSRLLIKQWWRRQRRQRWETIPICDISTNIKELSMRDFYVYLIRISVIIY